MRAVTAAVVLVGAAAVVGWAIYGRLQDPGAAASVASARPPVPVEVAPIERGSLALRRTFSGALEAAAKFVVAPKVSGRLERLAVDLGDRVRRGQIVARLDDAEYVQAVAQAEADHAVALANEVEARKALEIAERVLHRIESLRQQGVASESQLDAAKTDELARQASLEVARAQVTRAEASLAAAKIRLGYTTVSADWTGGDDERVVAERFVDEGDTVGANAHLLSIVELDPIAGIVFVPERDYARIRVGLPATLATDAYSGEVFAGQVDRIAPVFRQATRQARVELAIPNPDHRLKPGMFIRATVELDREEGAVIVPYQALTERDDRTGVFVVDGAGTSVSWRPVTAGVRDGERVQVTGDGLDGRVVTLGQHLCDDGSPITIPDEADARNGEAAVR